MPLFYLNLCDGAEFVEDSEGVELADSASAHKKAVESLRSLMSEDLLSGHLNTGLCIEIQDEAHRLMERVGWDEAVTLRDDKHFALGDRPPDK